MFTPVALTSTLPPKLEKPARDTVLKSKRGHRDHLGIKRRELGVTSVFWFRLPAAKNYQQPPAATVFSIAVWIPMWSPAGAPAAPQFDHVRRGGIAAAARVRS